MFEHLFASEFDDVSAADTPALVSAQAKTADWLSQMGSPEHLLDEEATNNARNAFASVTNPDHPPAVKRDAVLSLRTPPAVRHLAGMLSEYDWAFVEEAKKIRGYVVAKLLEETGNPDPRIRLRALELTGKLTEVGSFTERVEVVQKNASSEELVDRLRSKLTGLLPKVVEVQDITPTTP